MTDVLVMGGGATGQLAAAYMRMRLAVVGNIAVPALIPAGDEDRQDPAE